MGFQSARETTFIEMNTDPVFLIPKELWSLIDCLYNHGLNEVGLWREDSTEQELAAVRECLDTGVSLEKMK